jgi:hypothetical protein
MKKFSINPKYIVLALFVIFTLFINSNKIEASTTPPYSCSDGGTAYANVYINPVGPFPANASPSLTYQAYGQIFSTCSTRVMNLKVKDNGGNTLVDIIPDTSVSPGAYPFLPASVTFTVPATANTYTTTFTLGVDDTDPTSNGIIGSVFATGPHYHGSTYLKKVVYVGQAIHPQFTVRVKRYGTATPYTNTTNPNPPDSQDEIYVIPAGTASTTIPQIVSCSSNCGIPLEGANYSVVTSVSATNIDNVIPQQIGGQTLHVCKYPDAPGLGMYFSPVFTSGTSLDLTSTCADRYPDAETIR